MERVPALIMNADGTPATVDLAMRPSTTAPGRIKAAFVVEIDADTYLRLPDGSTRPVAEQGDEVATKAAITPEFRIEATG